MGEVVGAVAVVATLLYLSVQIREANKQAELEGMRHTLDGFNEWMDQIVGSKATASLLRRGREDLASLDEDERMQFEYLHLRCLNTIEGWYRSVDQTSRQESYRSTQVENIETVIDFLLSHPGTRAMWETYRDAFPLVAELVDRRLGNVPAEG